MAEEKSNIRVRLPRRLVDAIRVEAAVAGVSLSEAIARVLERHVADRVKELGTREALAAFIGCLALDPADGLDSSMVKDVFGRGLEEKHREGRL